MPKEIRRHRDPLRKLKDKGVYSADTCGDLTGYQCIWLVTGYEAFREHLRTEHPEGEFK
jgi:hypothetical protein